MSDLVQRYTKTYLALKELYSKNKLLQEESDLCIKRFDRLIPACKALEVRAEQAAAVSKEYQEYYQLLSMRSNSQQKL